MAFVSPKDLDGKNPGTWPIYYKVLLWIALAVVIAGLFYKVFVVDMNDQQEANQQKIEKSKETYKQLYQATLDLDEYRKRKEVLLGQLQELVKLLPANNQVDQLIDDVYKSAVDSSINLTTYTPVRPFIQQEYYDIAPVNLTTTTYYANFAQFSNILNQLRQIMNISNFELTIRKEANGSNKDELFGDNALVVSAQLQTYIYNQNIDDLRAGKLPKPPADTKK